MRPLALLLTGTAALLAGCAATPESSRPSVVASTDVYADIAHSIGGARVDVTAVLDDPRKDPHEYEATARDRLAVSRADLVIENGGGYDTFMTPLVPDSASRSPEVIVAVDELPLDGDNEHVWYEVRAAEAVAGRVAEELGRLDPAGAEAYTTALGKFRAEAGTLLERIDGLRALGQGRAFVATEPVPGYLLADLGLDDRTPAELSQSVEEGTDIPAGVLLEVLDLLSQRGVALVAYNAQTATGQTERIRQAAGTAGIPVVDFSETLPKGSHYLGWMRRNVDAVEAALSSSESGAHR
jgi:zinc/manganese transport system substrate-binding protein